MQAMNETRNWHSNYTSNLLLVVVSRRFLRNLLVVTVPVVKADGTLECELILQDFLSFMHL